MLLSEMTIEMSQETDEHIEWGGSKDDQILYS